MNRFLLLLIAASSANLALLCPAAFAADSVLIENVTLLSPEQPQPWGNRHVLVRDGRIAEISGRTIAAPAGVPRINGAGKFLTPGLFDAHVHVSQATGLPMVTEDPSLVAMQKAFFAQQPRSYLYFGVTQVLDPSNTIEKVTEFAAQKQHPDIFRCGAAPVVDGYPLVFVDEHLRHQVFKDFIFEPANANKHQLPPGVNASDHTPEAVVARIARTGALCVKVFIEDGFGDMTGWPLMSAETLRRVRVATRKHGLLMFAHANALDMQRMAVSADVDMIVHGVWNWNAAEREPGIPAVIDQHLREVHAKKIGYQATLRVLPGVMELLEPDLLDDPMYAKVVPKALLDWYRTEPAQWFKKEVFGPNPDAAAILAGVRGGSQRWETSERGLRALRHLYELGQPLLLGSDTPSAPTYANQPGYDTFREMKLMARAGVPLSAIFAAGTINNARALGLDKDFGTIEKGKVANLLLLDANPLASIDAWARIDRVILRGEVIERESLAADAR